MGETIRLYKRITSLCHENYSNLSGDERRLMQGIALVIKVLLGILECLGLVVLPLAMWTGGAWSKWKVLLVLWGAAESIYQVTWRFKLRNLKRRTTVSNVKDRKEAFDRALNDMDDIYSVLESWLVKRPKGRLELAYFIDWLYWIMFDKRVDQMTEEEHREAAEYVQIAEKKLGPLSNCKLLPYTTMRPSIDEFTMKMKPLIVYLVICGIRYFSLLVLKVVGFSRHEKDGMRYLLRDAKIQTGEPIVFIHGISAGFLPYLPTLIHLSLRFPGRKIILLEVPHIAMELTTTVLDREASLRAIDGIIEENGISSFSLTAHSYGTLVASWIVRNRPHLVTRLTFVDPVCFRLWDSTLAHNFLYAKPFSFLHELILDFVATDPLILHAISRELYWSEMILYPEHLTFPTNIIVSAKDWIIDPIKCYKYLKPHVSYIQCIDSYHGGFNYSRNFIDEYLDLL